MSNAANQHDLLAWLRLQLSSGIGPAAVRRLLAAFSLPERIFTQSRSALLSCVSEKQAASLLQEPEGFAAAAEDLLQWLAQEGHHMLTWGDAAYPQALLATADPPAVLYVQCHDWVWWQSWAAQEQAPFLAIVGSRNPTPQGIRHAHDFASGLVQRGYTVVSGLALGIDASAHEGALAGRGRTVAVVGTGLAQVYPRQHRSLAEQIVQMGGAIVSEYPLHFGPKTSHFPQRNRIVAGLSLGVLVVEANVQSGSLISARLSMESNREVFAIPGSIHAPQYKGCHALIKQGAKLVENLDDILDELPFLGSKAEAKKQATQAEKTPASAAQIDWLADCPETGSTPQAKAQTQTKRVDAPQNEVVPSDAAPQGPEAVLSHMGFDPIHLDTLLVQSQLPLPELQMLLLQLELQGRLQRLPGGLYQRIK